ASLHDMAPLLYRRAEVRRLRADASDLAEIAAERGLVRTGVSAAQDHGLDIVAPEILEAYASHGRAQELIRRYVLEPSARPNVVLHVVDGAWPFADGTRVTSAVVAALDL